MACCSLDSRLVMIPAIYSDVTNQTMLACAQVPIGAKLLVLKDFTSKSFELKDLAGVVL
jgi:hypothetical protein